MFCLSLMTGFHFFGGNHQSVVGITTTICQKYCCNQGVGEAMQSDKLIKKGLFTNPGLSLAPLI